MTSTLSRLSDPFNSLFDMLWPAVQSGWAFHPARVKIRIEIKAELGGNHHFFTKGSERFAHEFFVQEWAVNFGGVEKRNAAFHGCP